MKILCCGYRDWAQKIYKELEYYYKDEHQFIIVNSKEEVSKLDFKQINPDLILWYGWSWIIKETHLKDYFSVMLHPSPLPKYRGGSPIQNQIINGEKISAVTLFKMDEGLDTGDIIYQKSFSLKGNLDVIIERITKIGITLSIILIENFNNLKLTPQDHTQATLFKRRTPNQSEIMVKDFNDFTALDLHNKIRSLQDPYPNAFIKCKDGTKLYLTKSYIND